jgi:HEAT repeat protein
MGIFDIFTKEGRLKRRIEGARKKLTNMYYQTQDRLAAADDAAALAREGHEEGIVVLLQRYENVAPSTTVDQDEKEYIHRLLLGLGDEAVEPVADYIKRTTASVYWPLKFINEHLGEDEFAEFLAELLEETKADYVRDPQKKIGLVQLAGDYGTNRIYEALIPFVDDFDETVRFHAIDGVARSGNDGASDVLFKHMLDDEEESRRCISRMAEAFESNEWTVDDRQEEFREKLPQAYTLTPKGKVMKA